MIDLTVKEERLAGAVDAARRAGIVIPTFAQMAEPETAPPPVKAALRRIGLWDVHPLNLFRITWKNDPVPTGGGFGPVNSLELPSSLTGVDARIIALVGKWFPTGSHKVGATFGCLVPKLVTGQFDPMRQKAVWPSTGNFCRGGAYDAALLGCESVAILPEGMSRERFAWLSGIAGEVITTPGGESNVKEIFDKCAELAAARDDVVIFNQFSEYGNHLWHYYVTGRALEEALQGAAANGGRAAAFVSLTGSAGTLGAGDYLKEVHPEVKLVAGEALQCPTMLLNGHGDHRIEGIGDKHIPWIHNVRNTDLITAIDDEACLRVLRLFNEPEGRRYMGGHGASAEILTQLELLGISGVGNLLASIKVANHLGLTSRDIVLTVLTDSIELYRTRLEELRETSGPYRVADAAQDAHRYLWGHDTSSIASVDLLGRRRIHNLKYFTWIEQQGMSVEELERQWDEFPDFWDDIHRQAGMIDELIGEFNERTGVLKRASLA